MQSCHPANKTNPVGAFDAPFEKKGKKKETKTTILGHNSENKGFVGRDETAHRRVGQNNPQDSHLGRRYCHIQHLAQANVC